MKQLFEEARSAMWENTWPDGYTIENLRYPYPVNHVDPV